MWIWYIIVSALFLGLYDVAKKQSLRNNSVMMVLFLSSALSTLFLSPFFSLGPWQDHLRLFFKAQLVTCSWITGLLAMKLVPLSTVSTVKATRPVFVLLFSLILFAEKLNALQWIGCIMTIFAIFLLSRTSKKEGIEFGKNRGISYLLVSIITGVCSALYDKHILGFMDPVFVQCWSNFFITLSMGAILLFQYFRDKEKFQSLKWDWALLAIAVLITTSDFFYFKSLSTQGSLLSIVSMVRRSSVIVPFVFGALFWKEKHIKEKGFALLLILISISLITLATI